MRYYKGILSLISIQWRLLLQLCSDTDLVILTGISRKDFFEDVLAKITTFEQPNTDKKIRDKNIIESKSENEEFLGIKTGDKERLGKRLPSSAVVVCLEVDRVEVEQKGQGEENQDKIVDRPQEEQELQGNESHVKMTNLKKFAICPECNQLVKGGHLSRHRKENHTTLVYECNKCGNKFKRQRQLKSHTQHNCHSNSKLFPFTCVCGNTFKSKEKIKNHKISSRCVGLQTSFPPKMHTQNQ